MSRHPLDRRAAELLCDDVLEGLDEAEQRELSALLGGLLDDERQLMGQAAGAVDLLYLEADLPPLPEALRQRVMADAHDLFATSTTSPASTRAAGSPVASSSSAGPSAGSPPGSASDARLGPASNDAAPGSPVGPGRAWQQALPWLIAAASLAALVAVLVRTPAPSSPQVTTVVVTKVEPAPPPPVIPPAQRRQQLLAANAPIVRSPWAGTKDPAAAGVSGDVVWNPSTQEGYMHFHGLPANDPSKTQYQLWIFDRNQDERHPVDGGVFDVGPDGDAIVPITAKLAVHDPTLFAVTIEKPGGVVVSSRKRLVLAAKVPAG